MTCLNTNSVVNTNTHIHTETHIRAYLEFHDEMCEVEFGLQVQSDADVLLSCRGSNCHSASEQHISCVSLVSSSQNRPDCLTEGDLYISFSALLSLLQYYDYITTFSHFLLSVHLKSILKHLELYLQLAIL